MTKHRIGSRQIIRKALCAALLVLGAFWAAPCAAQTQEAKIAEVTGNGELRAADGRTYVLMGVELPKVPVVERMKRREIGFVKDDVIAFMRGKLAGAAVKIEPDASVAPSGQGEGAAVYVTLADGTLFNELIVAEGVAHAEQGGSYAMKDRLVKAEEGAMLAKKGLWSEETGAAAFGQSGVASINNQLRTRDFVDRYQGPADTEEKDSSGGAASGQ